MNISALLMADSPASWLWIEGPQSYVDNVKGWVPKVFVRRTNLKASPANQEQQQPPDSAISQWTPLGLFLQADRISDKPRSAQKNNTGYPSCCTFSLLI